MPSRSSIFADGSLKQVTRHRIFHLGALRAVVRRSVMQGGVLRVVAEYSPALTLTPSPSFVTASGFGTTETTSAVTVTPSGGTGPFTYAWTLVSTTGSTPTINSPSSASTTFTAPTNDIEAVFRCTATDSLGATATADVTASFFNLS